jgi:arylsulfatase A-like enzyme
MLRESKARVAALEAELAEARQNVEMWSRLAHENAHKADDMKAEREELLDQAREDYRRINRMKAERATLREALERIAEQQQKTLAVIKDNGFVFDSIGNEPRNWQHLAFTIYNDLCEVDMIARAALVSGEDT